MSRYTIGETASRTGFSASALRFYEAIGLVEPSRRTSAGYRLYDDAALERLAFVARAKQLGCTLEEIADLVDLWDGRHCGPVQHRLHDLLTTKLAAARHQARELDAFVAKLRAATDRLGGEPVDGPCRADCACLTAHAEPVACSLVPGAQIDRLAEWTGVLGAATRRTAIDGGMRLELGDEVDLGALGRLIAAEQRCCAFFRFALTVDAGGTVLDVRAPDAGADVLAAVFGTVA